MRLKRHESESLGLDGGDAFNSLNLGEEISLGGETGPFPGAEVLSIKRDDDLEVEASAADDTLHRLHASNTLDLDENYFRF